MMAAVSSSTAAIYVAPTAAASAPPDTGSATQGDPAARPAATPPAGSAMLAPDTAAALVAQQATDTADTFAGASAIVQQVQQDASLLVDGSGASDADKATAFARLYQLRFKVGGSATDPSKDDWFTQSTAAQRQVVNAEIDNSSFFKQAVAAASKFNAVGIGLARAGDTSASNSESARFAQLSTEQQTLIWAGGFSQFQSLDDVKSYLARQAAGNAAMHAAADAASGQAATSAAAAASATAAASPASDDPVTKAAKSLLASGPGVSMADVALTVLKNSAAAHDAAAKAGGDKADRGGADHGESGHAKAGDSPIGGPSADQAPSAATPDASMPRIAVTA